MNNSVTISDTPGFKTTARYYALNLLEELDAADEYYVDRGSGILYLFAPASQEKVR